MVFKSSLNRNGEGINVSSLNGETGDITLTSSGGTITITEPTSSTINLESNVPTGLSYQGTWNASTNTPTLTSGVGTNGYYYIVSVAGNTDLDGITDWDVGDWAIFNGTAWQKIDNSDTQYVLKAGDTMTGQLIIDNPGGDGLSVDGDVLFSNDFDIDINSGQAVTFNYGQTTGGNTATPFSIYDSRTSTGAGLDGTTLILSGISSARGTYKGIDQTLIIDNAGAESTAYGHLLEISQGTTDGNGFGHASFIPSSTVGAAIYGSTNVDKATFEADVAAGNFPGLYAGYFDGNVVGTQNITADTVNGNTSVASPLGQFTTVEASTVQGSPNLVVTAISTNARTARFGAYSNTTGIAAFSAGLTSTSSTGTATHDLNTACTIGSAYIYRVGGTDVSMADGGSGKSLTPVAGGVVWTDSDSMEVSAAGTAGQLFRSAGTSQPVWTSMIYPDSIGKGALVYGSATNVGDTLAGNITPVKLFLTQTGTGVVANDPAWGLIAGTDISVSFVDGTVLYATSGTVDGDPDDYNFNYEVSTGVLHLAKTNLTGYINIQEVSELDSSDIPLIRFGDDQNLSYTGFPFQIKWYAPNKTNPGGSLRFEDTGGTLLYNIRATYKGPWTGDTVTVSVGGTGATTLTGTLIGNGTSAFTAATSSTIGQVLRCTGANTFAYGAVDLADTDAVTGLLPYANLASLSANSVLGRATNTSGVMAAITPSATGQCLRLSGTTLGFGALDLSDTDAITGDLPFSNLTQIAGLSLLGVAGNSTADVAAITAASDGQVMRRNGTAIGFGTVVLDSANAVSGTLPVTRGGTGAGSYSTGGILFGNGTGAILSDSLFVWDTVNNLLGVGAAPPTTNPGRVYIQTSGFNIRMSSSETNTTTKTSAIVNTHYTTAEEPTGFSYVFNDSTTNLIRWGGGISATNSTTQQEWFTAANNTTVTGTRVFHINSSQNMLIGVPSGTGAGNCRLNVEKAGSAYTYTNGGIAVGRTVDDTGTGAAFTFMGYNDSTDYGFIDVVDNSSGYQSLALVPNGGLTVIGNPSTAVGAKLDVINSAYAYSFAAQTIQSNDDNKLRLNQSKTTTTNATVTTLLNFGTTTGSAGAMKILVIGRRTGGASGASGDYGVYERTIAFRNEGGTVTVNGGAGALDITAVYETPGYTVDAIQSGTSVLVRVTGVANTNISWFGQIWIDGMYTS